MGGQSSPIVIVESMKLKHLVIGLSTCKVGVRGRSEPTQDPGETGTLFTRAVEEGYTLSYHMA